MAYENQQHKLYGFGSGQQGGGGVGGGGGGDGGFLSQSPSSERKPASSLIPLSCHQVLTTEKLSGEMFKSGKRILNQVSVCGLLNGWQSASNGREVVVSINDTTSTINVTFFGNDAMEKLQEESRRPSGSKRRFVRIHGHIRPWNKETTVLGFQISFVSGPMHMMHHLLMCVTSGLYSEHGCLEKEPEERRENDSRTQQHQQHQQPNINQAYPHHNNNTNTSSYGNSNLMPNNNLYGNAGHVDMHAGMGTSGGGYIYSHPDQRANLIKDIIKSSQGRLRKDELDARVRTTSFPMNYLTTTLKSLINTGELTEHGDYYVL